MRRFAMALVAALGLAAAGCSNHSCGSSRGYSHGYYGHSHHNHHSGCGCGHAVTYHYY